MIQKTRFYSHKKGNLATGCKHCIKGEKSVLFITGICPRNCFFCPTSVKKKNNDVKYINERKYNTDKELIDEIKISGSSGVGITGGDPLSKLQRTIKTVKLLKKTFSDKFHVHLYTSPDLVTLQKLKKLYNSGLNEIRFHPDLDSDKLWDKILSAKKFNWDIGIEIPVIPSKKVTTKKLIKKFKDVVDFFNFNELEISDLNANAFIKRKLVPKDNVSYAVKGSEKLALELLKLTKRAHYCTCKLKDKVQLGQRLKLRAKNVAKEYDLIDEEGMLVRGVIYINAVPDTSYEKLLKRLNKKKEIDLLKKLRLNLIKRHKIPKTLIDVDKTKYRLL